jgi:hypothetical protein
MDMKNCKSSEADMEEHSLETALRAYAFGAKDTNLNKLLDSLFKKDKKEDKMEGEKENG